MSTNALPACSVPQSHVVCSALNVARIENMRPDKIQVNKLHG